MRWLRTLLSLVLLFTIGTVAFTMLHNRGEDDRQGRGKTHFPLPKADMILSDVRFVDTQEGRPNWVIESKRAQLFKEKNRAFFEGVHITFFSKDGKVMHLYSSKGILDTSTRDMTAEGDVRGRSSDGLQFFTSSLRYNYAKREIKTRDRVKIMAPNFQTEGVGMIVDLKNETVRLLEQVRSMGSQ